MQRTPAFRILTLTLVLGAWRGATVEAAAPWTKLMSNEQVSADPKESYAIRQENGPWMIMACSFSGDGAEKQAKELALELRKRYKLEAYVHKPQIKLEEPVGRGVDPTGAPARFVYSKFNQRQPEIKEVAVLVGNYSSAGDPEAQKTLQKLKYSDPQCLQIEEGRRTNRTLAALRTIQRAISPEDSQNKKKGPMGHAFITINPLLPPDYVAPKAGLDELVVKMNQGVKHSLLDCPGKYTVQVAHFTGEVVIDQRKIQAIENGEAPLDGKQRNSLAVAAEKAHTLTEELRKRGYEAYEFHDRYASIVTVGSFDSVGTPRADGKTEINPKIHRIMEVFGAKPLDGITAPAGTLSAQPRSLEGIHFDVQPIPVTVPKRSISRELARQR